MAVLEARNVAMEIRKSHKALVIRVLGLIYREIVLSLSSFDEVECTIVTSVNCESHNSLRLANFSE